MNFTEEKFMNFIAQLHELEVLHLQMMQSVSTSVYSFFTRWKYLKKEYNIYSDMSEEITGLDTSLFPITKGLQPGGAIGHTDLQVLWGHLLCHIEPISGVWCKSMKMCWRYQLKSLNYEIKVNIRYSSLLSVGLSQMWV